MATLIQKVSFDLKWPHMTAWLKLERSWSWKVFAWKLFSKPFFWHGRWLSWKVLCWKEFPKFTIFRISLSKYMVETSRDQIWTLMVSSRFSGYLWFLGVCGIFSVINVPESFLRPEIEIPEKFSKMTENDTISHMTEKWYFQPIQCVLWNWFVLPKFFHCYVYCDCPDLSVMFINGKRFSLQRVSRHSDWFSIISLDQSEIIFHSSLLAAFEDFGNHHEYSTCA